MVLSAGAAVYTDCISVEGLDSPNECSGYDIKQSNSEGPELLELWGIRSIPSLPSLLGPPWSGVVTPNRVLSMCQIKVNCVL